MAILPFVKVATVAIKQISKPIAKLVSKYATNHKTFSGGVEWMGQSLHRATVWTNRSSLGLGKAHRPTPPLEQAKALTAGAEFISESFLFAFAVGITAWEYRTSAAKTAHKEEVLELRLQRAESTIARLQARLDAQEAAKVHAAPGPPAAAARPPQQSSWSLFSGGAGAAAASAAQPAH
mmetsp:Transcript_5645/g.13717  ORF Transcript_5645/g.13717 Transcript_5645/m.13717 type:complete len:179 (+) Transcript_5645:95-631(+)|eukprot:CAMPEP_0180204544 /NCGR_PEP_ID=MMETSP0987-20121128/8478_1 /TAXON_ID=697907 /ORGANISM="non described non described, Strain CCMP2293" /LENGTH=178 /DNA_ID=CAMNT_0022160061 /DNA_START=159 /DNA_END=695 /DNA_ORIENTATION=+